MGNMAEDPKTQKTQWVFLKPKKAKEKEKEKEIQPPKDSRDKARRQIEQGILETAATDSRYSHLLNKEEEAIVKDVIKEFLT